MDSIDWNCAGGHRGRDSASLEVKTNPGVCFRSGWAVSSGDFVLVVRSE